MGNGLGWEELEYRVVDEKGTRDYGRRQIAKSCSVNHVQILKFFLRKMGSGLVHFK